jgi:hypothetical protein
MNTAKENSTRNPPKKRSAKRLQPLKEKKRESIESITVPKDSINQI